MMMEIMPQNELEKLKAMFYDIDTDEKKAISRQELKNSLKLHSKFTPEIINIITNAVRILLKK